MILRREGHMLMAPKQYVSSFMRNSSSVFVIFKQDEEPATITEMVQSTLDDWADFVIKMPRESCGDHQS
jgi:hypothetical protein